MWVFGYGSLVWRPDFPYIEKYPAELNGWSRRFYQGSTDHRGIPGAPGRVVTLLPSEGESCWGMVYRLEPGKEGSILDALDYREKNGYEREYVEVHLRGDYRSLSGESTISDTLVYFANASNPDYLGEAPLLDMAGQIARSHGPSGSNVEYLFRLAESLRAFAVEDTHVFSLEAEVQRLLRT